MKSILVLLAALVACGSSAQAQIAAEPMPFVRSFWLDQNGAICPNCLLWTYAAGSTTPLASYTTTAANVANTNPVVLDGSGRADVFLGPQAYKLVLESAPIPPNVHGSVLWTEDNISPLGLLAYNQASGGISACAATYFPPYTGASSMNLCTFLSSTIDVRTFGAVGVQGNCHASGINDAPSIQAALNYAATNGPMDVLLPNNYCWPILTHLWIPPGVRFHGEGRTSGYEVSSSGSLLIANSGWTAANTTFPFTQMVWETGDNFSSGAYMASNVTFGSEVDHMEINCNDAVGCGNVIGIGRQEKSSFHDLILSGGVPPSGGYSYGFFEQGVDCNGSTPNASGCLIAKSSTPAVSNPFSGQQGPDYHLEIFPSYNAPSANFIPFVEMGANNYKGISDSTLNCNGAGSSAGGFFWGDASKIGPGLHVEGCGSNNQFVIGNIPAGTGCNGGTNDLFISSDPQFVITGCAAQVNLSFVNVSGGIVNNQTGAPLVNITDSDYFYNSGQTAGPLGFQNGAFLNTAIVMSDPGQYLQIGYNPFTSYTGTKYSGFNAGNSNTTASANTRAYSCGNIYYNNATGTWPLGGDGSSDYSCMLNLNGGSLGLSVAGSAGGSAISTATLLTFTRAILSGSTGNFLVGLGWLNTTTGIPVNEGAAALQVHGGIGGDVQSASAGGCTTSSAAGATCSVNVTWHYTMANTSYDLQCSGISSAPHGSPFIQTIIPQTTGATVVISNGQNNQAIASGYDRISCFANSQ